MTLKSDAEFKEKVTCCLENDMRNLANFYQSTQKCQNRNFDGILLSEVENPCDQSYIVSATKVQRSYLS